MSSFPQLNDPKIRKSRTLNNSSTAIQVGTSPKIRKSSQECHDDSSRPLKRASSISYRIHTPSGGPGVTTPSPNTSRVSSINSAASSLSTTARNFIISRKNNSSGNLAGKIKNRVFSKGSSIFQNSNQQSLPTTPEKEPNFYRLNTSPDSTNSLFSADECQSSPISPLDSTLKFNPVALSFPQNDFKGKNLLQDLEDCENQVSKLTLIETTISNNSSFFPSQKCSQIFEIPEILSIIMFYVGHDDKAKIPTEIAPIRRNFASATEQHESSKLSRNLHNCLFVNKLWFYTTLDVLKEHIYFDDDSKLLNFYDHKIKAQLSDKPHRRSLTPTKSLVLHKLKSSVKQHHLDLISSTIDPTYLSWLELYICPKILPSPNLLTFALEKLILPGSRLVHDDFLTQVSLNCPNLKQLDIRACEMVTDAGIYAIGLRCHDLEVLNCGRHSRGELISDVGISSIIQNTNISTLGVAGCGITNACLWEIAIYRGKHIQRLSLNNCWKLNDFGLPEVLKEDYFHKLSVLEIRGCLNIKNFRPMVDFKKRQYLRKISVLIETCAELERRLSETQLEMDREISARIFTDISDWLNEDNDEDNDFRDLLLHKSNNNTLPSQLQEISV